MLTTYIKRETTRISYYASPAGSYLDEFTDWLARCGFHEEVICQYLPGTMRFAVWGEKTYGKLTSLPADALNHFRVHLAKCGQFRHTFASNALVAGPDRRDHVGRHMLALMTYLGHASPRSTFWYFESSPALMDDIVRLCEQFIEENTR